MRRPPHSPDAGIFSGGLGLQVAWTGAFIGLVTLAVGFVYHERHPDGPWQTVMFTTLALLQVFQAVATRSSRASLLAIGMFTNRVMLWTIGLVVGLQIAALYAPFLSTALLRVQPLGATEWLIAVAAGVALLLATEVEKWWSRRRG